MQQRYTQLIQEQRKRTFEKEWEKKNFKHQSPYPKRNRSRSRSGSFSGCTNSSRSKSGSFSGSMNMKHEMTAEEKEELESILSQPVTLPDGILETRPYDYKKKICHALKSKEKKGGSKSSSTPKKSDAPPQQQHHHNEVTEEDELYHRHGGRNPLFTPTKEDVRRKILLRDDHLMKQCHGVDDSFTSIASMMDETPLDPTDTAITQHIQHDLEALRIKRTDPANLGCSCRKLHVFLPGSTDKLHHKKKGSHRRLPERKVQEQLRKRGLLNKGNESMSREKMEKLLHDAIENEPCCWGNDCPCVRSGIGCQADTCSCWRNDVVSHHNNGNVASKEEDLEAMKIHCGNVNGMYIVNTEGIAAYRKQYVTTPRKESEV